MTTRRDADSSSLPGADGTTRPDVDDHDALESAEPRNDVFERFATRIGDLDSPFYDEERERDVWNEASAVGFQLMLWAVPLIAATSFWLGGATAMPYAIAMLIPWGLAAIMALAYAQRRGVDPGNVEALAGAPLRLWVFVVVSAGLASGMLFAASQLTSDSNIASFTRGAAQGGAVTFVVVTIVTAIVGTRTALRRRRSSNDPTG